MNGKTTQTYDAIVIGSGISGGWAAKELCEGGLKTLVLERGRKVEHIKDYPTAMSESWELPHRGKLTPQFLRDNPVLAATKTVVTGANQHFFVKDAEHPFVQEKPFVWVRGYQVGGKSLLWARWTQRWSDLDFEANGREGVGVDWPIRYRDLAPWYSHVERFVGISGNRDGLPQVPDGEFLPPMQLNSMELHFKSAIESRFPGRNLIISRTANLSQPTSRGVCLYRNRCNRGCPFGGYFSSNSATLPAATATGNLTLYPDCVVHSIIYDEKAGRAIGVRTIDAHTLEVTEFFSRIVFVNAGTINTALLLLNSTSARFPHGLGNESGQLGRNLMNHNYRVKASGIHDGLKDKYYFGRRPTGALLPRFRNFGADRQPGFLRGYAFVVACEREPGNLEPGDPPIGAVFKEKKAEVGPWRLRMISMGEQLPDPQNRMTLSRDRVDRWGIPLPVVDCDYRENELNMTKDMVATAGEMAEAAGFRSVRAWDSEETIGLSIHEMGTARMGRDPRTSVLNGFNQIHAVPNVFVTDGACMTSSGWQNPSITYMALTARAAAHALSELKSGNL